MKAGAFFAGLAVIATTLLSIDSMPANAQDKKPYTIYLSNNFVGNDWRQQMLRSADIAVKKPPLAGRVDLKVEVVENTVQAQINSLNNIIRNKPDAIVIDAGSGEALNPTIQKACDAGIVDHQLRSDRQRALRLHDGIRLGPGAARAGRMAGQEARRQGQDPRRSRACRRSDLRPVARTVSRTSSRNIPASRWSAISTATMRWDRSRPASPACWRPTRKSTRSSSRATAPERSRRCRMPAVRSCPSPAARST